MADLLRISLTGAMPSGEEWSINPVWSLTDFGEVVTPDQCLTIATAIDGVTVPASVLACFNPTTTVVGNRVEARTRAGVLEAQAEHARTTAVAGTGASQHPFQTSLVISLRTAQVGASGRGRLYLPCTGLGISNSTLRPTGAQITGVLTDMKTWLTNIGAAIKVTKPNAAFSVWSRTQSGLFLVNKMQAGDVLDVQRRRRDALIESYSSVSVP